MFDSITEAIEREKQIKAGSRQKKISLIQTSNPLFRDLYDGNGRGFTYIEVLLTLAILAVLFVPTMQLFSHAMEATRTSRDLMTAVSLVRWEMERVKNIGVSVERLKAAGNVVWPQETEEPVSLNGREWRIYRILKEGSAPLEVTVEVRAEKETKPMARLVTQLADTSWSQEQQVSQ